MKTPECDRFRLPGKEESESTEGTFYFKNVEVEMSQQKQFQNSIKFQSGRVIMKKVIFISILALLCVWQMGWGEIPKTISYQGVLTDPGGIPVPDSTYSITFRL